MKYIVFLILLFTTIACQNNNQSMDDTVKPISDEQINSITTEIIQKYGDSISKRAQRGIRHIASLWRIEDGTIEEFNQFCRQNFIADDEELVTVFYKISRALEQLYGHYNTMYLELQRPIHEPMGELTNIDKLLGSYSPDAHLGDDLFENKLAFHIALNFPYYSLTDKNELGKKWDRLHWAYARLGDVFQERAPANVKQMINDVQSASDIYVAEYNIYAGKLRNDEGKTWFPEDMVLLSHWNLRDELKSNYNQGFEGYKKQEVLYKVMSRIIDQTIPKEIINDSTYQWDPYSNELYGDNSIINSNPENGERFQQILNNFRALKEYDNYSPMPSFVERSFEGTMELTQSEIEDLFVKFLSSEEVKNVANIIMKRLGRNLEPWDIWYDGFKSRSSMDETKLDRMTQSKYKNAATFKNNIPGILISIGFSNENANFLSSKIDVDPARGSGHAWGAQMKGANAHLRTRIPNSGMNYKGYNIAIHELGHNVEQTISLYMMDHYMLNGVPSTAFTEALAFIFQKRDLQLLGINNQSSEQESLAILDIFWSTYEIMGVSLVDQYTWKWMYEHPNVTALELKDAVLSIAQDVWNKYYAPVFGKSDQAILAVYSHMISNPLYLTNYAVGNLIEYQIEEHLKDADFGPEVIRMFKLGRLTPNQWMREAVGTTISIDPILKSTSKALLSIE